MVNFRVGIGVLGDGKLGRRVSGSGDREPSAISGWWRRFRCRRFGKFEFLHAWEHGEGEAAWGTGKVAAKAAGINDLGGALKISMRYEERVGERVKSFGGPRLREESGPFLVEAPVFSKENIVGFYVAEQVKSGCTGTVERPNLGGIINSTNPLESQISGNNNEKDEFGLIERGSVDGSNCEDEGDGE